MQTPRGRRWVRYPCVLSLVLVWASLLGPTRAQEGGRDPDPMPTAGRIIVLPFRNISGDPETEWIGVGIAEALTTDLPRTGDTAVVGRDAVAATVTELELPDTHSLDQTDALAVTRRAGARWLIHGGYQQLETQIRITARLIDGETGVVIRGARVDGMLEELFALQDQILPGLGWSGATPAPFKAGRAGGANAVAPNLTGVPDAAGASRAPAGAASAAAAVAPRGGLAIVPGAPPPPVPPATVSRNAAGQVTVRAVRMTGGLDLDGRLDEEIYRTVEAISDFVQIEPDAGAPATEKTEVWLFFDETNFYISARAWHSAPESHWIANEMRRDSFTSLSNENFAFLLDTFYDRRNGVRFSVNPIGGRMDGQITNERDYNGDWNPIWDVRTGRFEGGWTLEAEIPFKSLRYRSVRRQVWGIQLHRNLQSKNESAYLTPLDQGLSRAAIFQASQAATLVGVEVPVSGRLFEVKPYLIGDVNSVVDGSRHVANDLAGTVGLDVLKYGITENLTADFTLNTDFAQVEADTQQVNLTRFSLFFPEKREFFLENQGLFAFGGAGGRGPSAGSAETPIMFYSRQIGLNAGREVPLRAGGRVTGRIGKFSLGLLNIQTGAEDVSEALSTNFTVARVKRDLLRRSSIGALVTNRSALVDGPGSNQSVGIDGAFAFYDNVLINTYWARTRTTDDEGRDSSYKGEFRYNGDRYGLAGEHLFVDERFSPGIGFLLRPDLRKSFGSLRFSPRPASIDWIRRFSWDGSYNSITDSGGTVETREAVGSFLVELENSDHFSVFYTNTYDLLQDPFVIASDVTIPVGGYRFSNTQASYAFGPQRPVSGRLSVDRGSFYGGTKTAVAIGGGFGPSGAGRIELSPRFSLEPGLSINRVELPQGSFTSTLVTTRTTYTFTPTMFLSALIQYNSSNSALSSNIRLRWEYQPGSELFVVYNEQRDTLTPSSLPKLENRAFIIKLNRLFRF